MTKLLIGWREAAIAFFVFFFALLIFALLSAIVGWPKDNGWLVAVGISFVFACAPVIGRVLSFLEEGRGSVEAFGLKIDFSNAARAAQPRTISIPEAVVEAEVDVPESRRKLGRAAEDFLQRRFLLVDLEDGRAWHKSRLFAVVATAHILRSPSYVVLVGQRAGRSKCLGGWISPRNVIKAFAQQDAAYGKVLHAAEAGLQIMRARAANMAQNLVPPSDLMFEPEDVVTFNEVGDAFVLAILHKVMRAEKLWPSKADKESPDYQPKPGSEWAALVALERELDPWLVRETIDLNAPQKDQLDAMLKTDAEIVLVTQNGQFAGVVDVRNVVRDIVRQVSTHALAAQ